MASGSRDLSTRMSAEDENIEKKRINDIALTYFKKYKVEISGAIKTTFPFLELLRDHEFITNEMYEKAQESYKKRFSIHEVIYDVLSELEKKFDISLLGALFSKPIMKNYPDLFRIYKIFYKGTLQRAAPRTIEIPDIKFLLESDGEESAERPNEQLSLEQGTGETSYQRLTWLGPDACNYNDTVTPERGPSEHLRETQAINATEACTTSDNRDAVGSLQANEKCAQQSKTAGIREHMDVNVVFDAEILPVTCGEMKGILIKRKFERGSTVKCIRSQDGNWFTLHEYELKGGYETSNWRNNVCCYRKTLKWLMEKKHLPKPPRTYGKIKKPEKEDKCKICGDEEKLFKCSWCFSFFHGDCHIPPVDPKRKPWICTFCTTDMSSQSQQCHSESAVLARQMGPEEKSKCELLLLKAYCHFETNIFPNIPHQNYFQKASQCLATLRTLDEIKNKLNGGCFTKVKEFVLDMNKIFQDPKHNNSDLIKEEFKKNFKEVFAIQKTN